MKLDVRVKLPATWSWHQTLVRVHFPEFWPYSDDPRLEPLKRELRGLFQG